MKETIFDNVNERVVQSLSERPEAVFDTRYLKESANSGSSAVQSDLCNRTPLNLTLPGQFISALNLALTAEYLVTEFYSRGLNTPGLIPNDLRLVFMRILLNEVGARETLLTLLGDNAFAKPMFDFTARGAVASPFSSFTTFLNLGRAFEDLIVRAYKGQAGNVMSDDYVLLTALRFHSVHARHASELRRISGLLPYITLDNRDGLPAAFQGIYRGEDNIVQGGLNLVSLTGFSAEKVSQAFDEPLTADEVMFNLSPFIRTRRGFGPFNPRRDDDDGNNKK